jgi:hypothetical protein
LWTYLHKHASARIQPTTALTAIQPSTTTTQHNTNSLVRRDWRSCAFALLELFLRLLADEEAEDAALGAPVYEGFSLPFAQIEAAALQAVAERQFKGDVSLGLRSLVAQVGRFVAFVRKWKERQDMKGFARDP